MVALLGAAATYACIDWKRALSVFDSVDVRDQDMLLSVGPKKAKRMEGLRFLSVVVLGLALLLVLMLGMMTWIGSH